MSRTARFHLITALIMVISLIPPWALTGFALPRWLLARWGQWEGLETVIAIVMFLSAAIGFLLGLLAQPALSARCLLTGCAPLLAALIIILLAVAASVWIDHLSWDSALRNVALLAMVIVISSTPAMGFARLGHYYRHRRP